jgi:hypothetical protein
MRRASILLLALILVPAASADAKFSSARVCGPSDCREVTPADGDELLAMEAPFIGGVEVDSRGHEHRLSAQSKPTSEPPAATPWYRVTLCPGRCDSGSAPTLRVLPSAGYEDLGPNGWVILGERVANVYRSVTRGLQPFPASRLSSLDPAASSSSQGDASGHGGIPAWTWITVAAVAAALSALRWMRRGKAERDGP